MTIEIRVPEFGESVVEATVGRWLKREGESVALGEPVVELETEKVNTTVAAEEAGVVGTILHKEGETVRPGDVLGTIEAGAAGGPPAAATPAEERSEQEEKRSSPIARRAAAELRVDLDKVRGTGPGGRVMKEDVEAVARERAVGAEAPAPPSAPPAATPRPSQEAATAAPAAPPSPLAAPQAPAAEPRPAPPPSAPAPGVSPIPSPSLMPMARERAETRQRLSRRRITIARRLVEAHQTAAMLTTFNEIDMQTVVELRKRRRAAFRERTGVDLGYMSFFLKATVGALKAFPQLNAELQGDDLVLKHYYDIGIAIGDPGGLVVPVLRDADRLTFAQIEQAIGEFVRKAADRTLNLEDLRGGTFTITNGGVFGSLLSTPMLNPPQVGILGMHKIAERPTVVEGQVAAHPMMFVALTYDHRVIDGRDAVLFLAKIKELVEDPERLLLEG